jgi:protoheme IX farnesyltransferase
MLHISGWVYFWGVLLMGTVFLGTGAALYQSGSILSARRVLRASVIYLPLLLLLILVDHSF